MFKDAKAYFLPSIGRKENSTIWMNANKQFIHSHMSPKKDTYEYYDVYVTAYHNEEITRGDYCIIELGQETRVVKVTSLESGVPSFPIEIEEGYANLDSLKKIIATSDQIYNEKGELLPQISEKFIEILIREYEDSPINIQIEFNDGVCQCSTFEDIINCNFHYNETCTKPDPNNDFYGRKVKNPVNLQLKKWNKREIEKLIYASFAADRTKITAKEFIKKHL